MKTALVATALFCLACLPAQAQVYLDLKDTASIFKKLFKAEGVEVRTDQITKKSYSCGYLTATEETADDKGRCYVKLEAIIPLEVSNKPKSYLLYFLTGQHQGNDGDTHEPFWVSFAVVQDIKGKEAKELTKFEKNVDRATIFSDLPIVRVFNKTNIIVELTTQSTKGGIYDNTVWYDVNTLKPIFSEITSYSNSNDIIDNEPPLHEYKVSLNIIQKKGKQLIEATKKGKNGSENYTEATYYTFDEKQKSFIRVK